MCGIVGYIGTQAATEILLAGLEKLEYRGYDSAGIATVWEGDVNCVRAKGKLHNLRSKLEQLATPSQIGIGHTRWATHGKPEEYNAHPHLDTAMRIAVVQNGIIENYRELRDELKQKGHEFRSETDTEVIPHLIAEFLKNLPSPALPTSSSSLLEAIRQAVNHLQGAFAIAVISADYPDELIVVRQQAPLVIGFGQGEFFCASDTPAIVSHTRAVLPLENGEIARLTPLGVEIYNFAGDRLKKQPRLLNLNPTMVEKQGFKHFMLKEIYEQPGVVRASLEAYFNPDTNTDESFTSPVNLGLSEEIYADLEQIHIVACGTSWHAALVGKYLLEQLAGISTQVHYASEYRYAPSPLTANTLIIGVTQSGETADTLAALAMEKERRQGKEAKYQARLLGITNRPESSLGHLVPHIINTLAGIEIGVAATKTFVAQLMAFYALALDLAYHRQTVAPDKLADIIQGLRQIPKEIEATLERQEKLTEHLAHEFAETQDFIFLGRGINFPIALEGALKLKEISYIHAEGYPAGEMKHGPIALLDAKVPVVAIAYPGSVYEKVISNSQEAKARDSRLIGVTPVNDGEAAEIFNDLLPVSSVDELLSPILTVVPLQLLAYHIAARRGLDVDQPRNLAKSVTVE
ncbi:glutamine--fructose-6-phosphate transaminase [Trichormus variabilis ATCC 29413]|uniref:Glutamine--fructose-6-phosphate aminotransferase [isomerizing] n=2 Tax=Anabaena variabilis TaxID=264691 RepID=Q3M7E4_TRIV2|nr:MULTISPECIES: glutamine--fructose-6-phosphate transaminase (isomerizing) [Nostocaceae]ABA23092.1 glutamine--fructose-6-phosphate transaminase [Trichormus variabilis ATCC 29413]MBC1214076.1 glutamine--fructose-6-phosphate transaminase (isomerizing) [Trichormus variabilis ARAD]MBC1257738.1 glutamine--fructose-6-phosphate transaminase (isomerizing) [Trichormus variabilis V5]MBC1265715.1 glutamine--fructose-6-phosphate transaminase (isomerizing) [Trichormus variabilis FSR]MBC1303337.1 glutamine